MEEFDPIEYEAQAARAAEKRQAQGEVLGRLMWEWHFGRIKACGIISRLKTSPEDLDAWLVWSRVNSRQLAIHLMQRYRNPAEMEAQESRVRSNVEEILKHELDTGRENEVRDEDL